jgi:glycosyltransferase involved in cell wall biosynthesis
MNPLVSVCVQTYNHEPFIAEALDSILEQRTSFPFEVLVGEDDSTDVTRPIVQDYERRYPELIRAFYHRGDDKLYIDGRKTGRRNFVNNLRNARGKFIALLDGDDYWTDPDKLQKQVYMLSVHKGLQSCFHRAWKVNEAAERELFPPKEKNKETFTKKELLHSNFIATSSVMFRNWDAWDLPEWFFRVPMADWALHLLNAGKGDIGFVDAPMSVHRQHGEGAWVGLREMDALALRFREVDIFSEAMGKSDVIQLRIGEDREIRRVFKRLLKDKGIGPWIKSVSAMRRRYPGRIGARTLTVAAVAGMACRVLPPACRGYAVS